MSALEGHFALLLLSRGMQKQFERQFKFHPTRKWRFDYADPVHKVAVEIDGGIFLKGGGYHNRGAGFRENCEKLNAAASLGWRVFRYVERSGMAQFFEDYKTLLNNWR